MTLETIHCLLNALEQEQALHEERAALLDSLAQREARLASEIQQHSLAVQRLLTRYQEAEHIYGQGVGIRHIQLWIERLNQGYNLQDEEYGHETDNHFD